MVKRALCLLAALAIVGVAHARELDPHKILTQYSRTVWSQAQRLPQDAVYAITQTDDGYLWIGTSEGLARFDGYDFVVLDKEHDGLPANAITALASSGGSLWIGTPNGLAEYREGHLRTYTINDGLPDNAISRLYVDRSGTLWIVVGLYLSRYDSGKFTTYAPGRDIPVTSVRAVSKDRSDRLWVAGFSGVTRRNGSRFETVIGRTVLGGMSINAMLTDMTDNVWIAGTQGLILRSPDGRLRRFDVNDGLPDTVVLSIRQNRNGTVWVGTSRGIARFEGDRFVGFPHSYNHLRDPVFSIFEDQEGNLWAGTNSGLNRFRDDVFTVYGTTEGLPSDVPNAVLQDRSGRIWIGFQDAGLLRFSPTAPRVYTRRDGLPSDEVLSIRESQSGDLLLATRAGFARMHGNSFITYNPPDRLARPTVYDALEDRRGRLWLATPDGIGELRGRDFHVAVPGGPLVASGFAVLCEGRDGTIWAGTLGKGLWRIHGGAVRQFTTSEGLPSNGIRSLYEDPEGTLWIGTFAGGLGVYRNGKFARFSVDDGLLSNNVSHVTGDGEFLWLSTTRGICRVKKQDLFDFAAHSTNRLPVTNYGIADGLRSAQCAPSLPIAGGGTRTSDGRLWFPTSRGLAILDPSVPSEPARPLGVHILEVLAEEKRVDMSRPAHLPARNGRVQIHYSAIHLAAPELVSYAYKMEGVDAGWVEAGNRRSTTYNNLRHGSYRFVVSARLPGGLARESSYSFVILPHFYETSWFALFCVVTLFAAAAFAYRFRLRHIHSRFALVLEERARLAREIHDTLAQGFVGIASQLEALAACMPEAGERAAKHLDIARKMARHSLTEARRSVMDLRASSLEDRDLTAALEFGARMWTAGSGVDLDLDIKPLAIPLSQDVEQNLLRITQEAVTNAVKHASATRISVCMHATPDGHHLMLRVSDNGKGFEQDGVFSAANGHFGLVGMRERARRVGGRMNLETRQGVGTAVELVIPTP